MTQLILVEQEELLARKASLEAQLDLLRSMPSIEGLEDALDHINFLLGDD